MMHGFKTTFASHKLSALDADFMTFNSEHEIHLEACSFERFYQRRFSWTGSGSGDEMAPELDCDLDRWGVPRHKIHGEVISEGKNRIYIIDLGRMLEPGDKEIVRVKHFLRDFESNFQPILSAYPSVTRGPIGKLKFEVEVPVGSIQNVRHETYQGSDRKVIDTRKLDGRELPAGRESYSIEIAEEISANRGHGICWEINARLT